MYNTIRFIMALSGFSLLVILTLVVVHDRGIAPNLSVRGATSPISLGVNPVSSLTSAPVSLTEAQASSLETVGIPLHKRGVIQTPSLATHRVFSQVAAKVISSSNVSTPGPLIKRSSSPDATTTKLVIVLPVSATSSDTPSSIGVLNQRDVIMLTNNERVANGLPSLAYNKQLSEMANAKAVDMIQKQYFAHVSPDGIDLSKLAQTYGYGYLNVGENLALGDFTSSADVVTGWMNSPGHRANILNKNFTEIGVAAIQGNYEGRVVWYAVQEFGRPLAACSLPDPLLKKKIDISQGQINTLEQTLANLKAEIDTPGIDTATYNAKVADYNTLVALYDQLIGTTKQDIQSFNAAAGVYNMCVGV